MPFLYSSAVDCLKRKMLERVSTKTFTDEDCQEIMKANNITIAQIKDWVSFFQFRCKGLPESEIISYLQDASKVRHLNIIHFLVLV